MNGSAPTQVAKQELGTTAAEICVIIPQEAGVTFLVRAASALPSPVAGTGADGADATAGVVWRRLRGSAPVVHAYAVNACVDVPLCGSVFRHTGQLEELPPPPANLGPYRRCKKCMAALGRQG